jgi:hypothetical protein
MALDPREKVSQNSFSFLISQKAVAPMSYEWRRSRDLSNGCGPPTRKADAKPCGANVRSSVSIAQTRHSPSGQKRKFKLTHYPAVGRREAELLPTTDVGTAVARHARTTGLRRLFPSPLLSEDPLKIYRKGSARRRACPKSASS